MLRKLAVALVAMSLIAGPTLAQSSAPVTGNNAPMTTGQPAKADAKKAVTRHVAKTHVKKTRVSKAHVTKKHIAKRHVTKVHASKDVKHVKTIKNAKRVKHPANKAS